MLVSRLAMGGVDLYTVQRAGGRKTQVVVQRYAHPSADHMRAAFERLARGAAGAQAAQATAGENTGTGTGTKTGPEGPGGKGGGPTKAPKTFGTPGGIRTPDPRLRRPMLYPTELRARVGILRG